VGGGRQESGNGTTKVDFNKLSATGKRKARRFNHAPKALISVDMLSLARHHKRARPRCRGA